MNVTNETNILSFSIILTGNHILLFKTVIYGIYNI